MYNVYAVTRERGGDGNRREVNETLLVQYVPHMRLNAYQPLQKSISCPTINCHTRGGTPDTPLVLDHSVQVQLTRSSA